MSAIKSSFEQGSIVVLLVECLLDQPDDDREVPALIIGRQDD